ncbi:MAG: hypothetical protein HQL37_11675, partial [Alphaproteobacteria bacterium]|nr:hypothetical protein [Alphaproteobacteria bacterium]
VLADKSLIVACSDGANTVSRHHVRIALGEMDLKPVRWVNWRAAALISGLLLLGLFGTAALVAPGRFYPAVERTHQILLDWSNVIQGKIPAQETATVQRRSRGDKK